MRTLVLTSLFLMGAVFDANLSRLIPTNQAYDASWAKVALTVGYLLIVLLLELERGGDCRDG